MRELGEALAEWLFARGIEEDVRGISLKARWLYDPATRQSLVTPTPAPVAVSAPTAASVPTSDPIRQESGTVVRDETGDIAKDEEAMPSAPSLTPSAADRELRPSSKPSAESKRAPRISRWVAIASLGLAAALGALVLKAIQTAPAPKLERSVGRSVDLLLLEALRSTHSSASSQATSPSARSTPEPRPSKRDRIRDRPREPSPAPPSSSPSAGASAAPPTTPTTAPSADPATQIYPDSL